MDTIDNFKKDIHTKGWYVVKNAYDEVLIDSILDDVSQLESLYAPIQKKAGVYNDSVNAFHHVITACPNSLKLLDPNPIDEHLKCFFEGEYILNTFGATITRPNKNVYTQNIHRDVRTNTKGLNILINALILLDDSTIENGATWMYSGSQNIVDQPSEDDFYDKSIQVTASRGDIILFDGNLWHAAGENKSKDVRRVYTTIYTKPYIKQQLDYPRAFGYDFVHRSSSRLKQILGYNSLTPTCLDEWYKPREDRFYKTNQG